MGTVVDAVLCTSLSTRLCSVASCYMASVRTLCIKSSAGGVWENSGFAFIDAGPHYPKIAVTEGKSLAAEVRNTLCRPALSRNRSMTEYQILSGKAWEQVLFCIHRCRPELSQNFADGRKILNSGRPLVDFSGDSARVVFFAGARSRMGPSRPNETRLIGGCLLLLLSGG